MPDGSLQSLRAQTEWKFLHAIGESLMTGKNTNTVEDGRGNFKAWDEYPGRQTKK